MHSFHPSDERPVPRSKLGATLLRLHRNLEGSRQREQAALDLFETWQSRWSDHREVIAERLECLDQELAQLVSPQIPSPHLSLMAMCETSDEERETLGTVAEDEGDATGAVSPRTHHILWHGE
ncbi:MAG: hypothetical protein V4719_19255 [Planctomycetota bacterium]